jgi:transposase
VENSIRPFVVGRKGWLFADTVGGANASVNLYSLIETAKANGIEPYRYLVALFKKLPFAQTADDYQALLAWNVALPSA